jgi:hypothetical protein
MAIFMDIEFVCLEEAEAPDAFAATFDVIYAGETWCRSVVMVDAVAAAQMGHEEREIVRVSRNALLELIAAEAIPVSFHLRLTPEGTAVLGRATPR